MLRISPIVAGRGMDHVPEVGFDPRRAILNGVAHMTALREAVGPEVEIIFEVHTRLSPARAVELCRQLEGLRPFFVEDPIRSENPAPSAPCASTPRCRSAPASSCTTSGPTAS